MDKIELKNQIISMLKTLPVCKPSSNLKNWTVRCPYCGDSKTANHGHFSILIDTSSDRPMLYRCFRCNESGILTEDTLNDLRIGISEDLKNSINIYNKKSSFISRKLDLPKKYEVPEWNHDGISYQKIEYINSRLGTNISYDEAREYKIILNFTDFLLHNNIPIGMKDSMIKVGTVRELDKNYVGFLSSNNNKITFRNINDRGFFGRYYKVTLDLINTSPNTFYALNSMYDLVYTDDIHIFIAEGTFDILSIFKNLNYAALSNRLFIASCGFGFNRIIKYLIYQGVTTDINLHIFADNDKSDKEILQMFQNSFYRIWIDKIIIHRNSYPGEKDFGVPKERINDYKYILK